MGTATPPAVTTRSPPGDASVSTPAHADARSVAAGQARPAQQSTPPMGAMIVVRPGIWSRLEGDGSCGE